jgi:hypothetical protein
MAWTEGIHAINYASPSRGVAGAVISGSKDVAPLVVQGEVETLDFLFLRDP